MVVLPAPLRPTSPIRSPAANRKEVGSNRSRGPTRSSRSVASSMGFLRKKRAVRLVTARVVLSRGGQAPEQAQVSLARTGKRGPRDDSRDTASSRTTTSTRPQDIPRRSFCGSVEDVSGRVLVLLGGGGCDGGFLLTLPSRGLEALPLRAATGVGHRPVAQQCSQHRGHGGG